jgi:hypothetical protein
MHVEQDDAPDIEIRLAALTAFALVLKGFDFGPHLGEGGVIVFVTWFIIVMSVNLLTSRSPTIRLRPLPQEGHRAALDQPWRISTAAISIY